MTDAGISASDLDMIFFATISPDHEFPGTACFLQEKLGLTDIPAIDVRQQCSGYVFALSQARQYLATGAAKNILVVASEIHSKCLNWTPKGRDVTVLFGDGAAASVLTTGQAPGRPKLKDVRIGCQGSGAKSLWCPAPGTGFKSEFRLEQWMLDEGLQFVHMNGRAVFQHAVKRLATELTEITQRNNWALADVDLIVLHQANLRIVEAVADLLKLPMEKFHCTIQKYGNTTAASIPLGLCDARESGRWIPGQKVALAAFGAGFTFGSALIEP
jgi:3-oxoacyl-[acyl-carrier-protein] synthase-3